MPNPSTKAKAGGRTAQKRGDSQFRGGKDSGEAQPEGRRSISWERRLQIARVYGVPKKAVEGIRKTFAYGDFPEEKLEWLRKAANEGLAGHVQARHLRLGSEEKFMAALRKGAHAAAEMAARPKQRRTGKEGKPQAPGAARPKRQRMGEEEKLQKLRDAGVSEEAIRKISGSQYYLRIWSPAKISWAENAGPELACFMKPTDCQKRAEADFLSALQKRKEKAEAAAERAARQRQLMGEEEKLKKLEELGVAEPLPSSKWFLRRVTAETLPLLEEAKRHGLLGMVSASNLQRCKTKEEFVAFLEKRGRGRRPTSGDKLRILRSYGLPEEETKRLESFIGRISTNRLGRVKKAHELGLLEYVAVHHFQITSEYAFISLLYRLRKRKTGIKPPMPYSSGKEKGQPPPNSPSDEKKLRALEEAGAPASLVSKLNPGKISAKRLEVLMAAAEEGLLDCAVPSIIHSTKLTNLLSKLRERKASLSRLNTKAATKAMKLLHMKDNLGFTKEEMARVEHLVPSIPMRKLPWLKDADRLGLLEHVNSSTLKHEAKGQFIAALEERRDKVSLPRKKLEALHGLGMPEEIFERIRPGLGQVPLKKIPWLKAAMEHGLAEYARLFTFAKAKDEKEFVALLRRSKEYHERNSAVNSLTEQERHALVNENMGFIMHIANLAHTRFGHFMSFEECRGAAEEGMVKASHKFDPERGVKFVSYAAYWMWNSIYREARVKSPIPLPANVYPNRNALEDAVYALETGVEETSEMTLGAKRHIESVSAGKKTLEDLKAEATELNFLISMAHGALSLDKQVNEDGKAAFGDLVGRIGGQERAVELSEMHAAMQGALHVLTSQQQEAIREYYLSGEKRTLQQIGNGMGVSRERVRQIKSAALTRLGRVPEIRELLGEGRTLLDFFIPGKVPVEEKIAFLRKEGYPEELIKRLEPQMMGIQMRKLKEYLPIARGLGLLSQVNISSIRAKTREEFVSKITRKRKHVLHPLSDVVSVPAHVPARAAEEHVPQKPRRRSFFYGGGRVEHGRVGRKPTRDAKIALLREFEAPAHLAESKSLKLVGLEKLRERLPVAQKLGAMQKLRIWHLQARNETEFISRLANAKGNASVEVKIALLEKHGCGHLAAQLGLEYISMQNLERYPPLVSGSGHSKHVMASHLREAKSGAEFLELVHRQAGLPSGGQDGAQAGPTGKAKTKGRSEGKRGSLTPEEKRQKLVALGMPAGFLSDSTLKFISAKRIGWLEEAAAQGLARYAAVSNLRSRTEEEFIAALRKKQEREQCREARAIERKKGKPLSPEEKIQKLVGLGMHEGMAYKIWRYVHPKKMAWVEKAADEGLLEHVNTSNITTAKSGKELLAALRGKKARLSIMAAAREEAEKVKAEEKARRAEARAAEREEARKAKKAAKEEVRAEEKARRAGARAAARKAREKAEAEAKVKRKAEREAKRKAREKAEAEAKAKRRAEREEARKAREEAKAEARRARKNRLTIDEKAQRLRELGVRKKTIENLTPHLKQISTSRLEWVLEADRQDLAGHINSGILSLQYPTQEDFIAALQRKSEKAARRKPAGISEMLKGMNWESMSLEELAEHVPVKEIMLEHEGFPRDALGRKLLDVVSIEDLVLAMMLAKRSADPDAAIRRYASMQKGDLIRLFFPFISPLSEESRDAS